MLVEINVNSYNSVDVASTVGETFHQATPSVSAHCRFTTAHLHNDLNLPTEST